MQSFTVASRSLLQGGVPLNVSIAVDAISGAIILTDDDILQDSFAINRNSVSGQSIEIGNANATELVFMLDNEDRRFDTVIFEGAELTVTLSVGNESWIAGKFTVDQPPQGIDTISVAALDNMVRFDRPYSTLLTGKQTLLAILQDSCAACGVVLGTTSFTNSGYMAVVPAEMKINHRQVVAWVAQLAGANAWIDEAGALRLSWYGENQGTFEIEITPDDYNIDGYVLAENDVVLSGLIWRTPDIDYLWGESDYALAIEGNSLIDPDNYNAALTAVYDKINGFFYRPFAVEIVPMPWVWQLDMIQLTTITGQVIPSIVTGNRVMTRDGSWLAGDGETATSAGYATYAPFSAQQSAIIQKTTREVMQVWGVDAGWVKTGILDAERIGAGTISAEKLNALSISTDQAFADALAANDAFIANLSADQIFVNGLTVNVASIIELDASRIVTGYLSAARLEAGSIVGSKLTVGAITSRELATDSVTAVTIKAGEVTAIKLAADSVESDKIKANAVTTAKLDALAVTTDKIAANAVTAAKINVGDLTANAAFVNNLDARYATILSLTVDDAYISDLFANKLLAGFINAGSLNAAAINASTVNATLANAVASTINTAFITDALVTSLSADKLTAGSIKTNQISILSGSSESESKLKLLNEHLIVNDGTLDRVVVGKYNIGAGDRYGLLVRGADGTTVLLDENGVTNAGIINGAVTNSKVADNANIAGSKLDINSVVSSVNGATTQLNASKVQLNTEAQTLEIAFNSLKSTVISHGSTITSQGTSISVIQGQISSKVWQTDIDLAVDGFDARIVTAETSITQNADAIALKASQSDMDTLADDLAAAESSLIIAGNRISAVVTSNVDDEGNYIVDGHSLVSAINLTGEGVSISADKINLAGRITLGALGDDFAGVFSIENNRTVIDGGVLKTGSVKAGSVDLKNLTVSRLESDGSTSTTLAIANDGSISMIGSLRSANYTAMTGWQIDEAGEATFNQAIIRGSVLLDNAGMTDDDSGSDAVRIWAGTNYDNRAAARFRVLQDGRLYATDGYFEGTFTGSLELGDIKITDETPGEAGQASIIFDHGAGDIPIRISTERTYFGVPFFIGTEANKRFSVNSNEILLRGSRVRISQTESDVDAAKDVVFPNAAGGKLALWNKGAYSFDVVDDGFVFGSNRYPTGPNFVFKNEGGAGDIAVQIQGKADITSEITMGSMSIRRRTDAGNTGIDFIF